MQDEQKFGLSIEELATRETVYKENLLENFHRNFRRENFQALPGDRV